MGPQRAAQRLAAKPSAASFIRNRPTPAADLILLPIELRPANAAGADHDDAAVTPAMCADACGPGIGDENRHAIGMFVASRNLELAGFAGARQCHAGHNPVEIARRQSGPTHALDRGLEHRGKALLHSKANIGRARDPFT